MKHAFLKLTVIISLTICFSCKKKADFLLKKPSTFMVVPRTLSDFTRLLDHTGLNTTGIIGIVSADDYYLANKQSWENLTLNYERNGYIWAKDIFQGMNSVDDWNEPFLQILHANVVLEGLKKLKRNDTVDTDYNRIKGHALFIRGHALFNLSQIFAEPFDANTAKDRLGLPIRLQSDISVNPPRATLQQTYDQIINDILEAERLLPHKVPGADLSRPYKVAAQALLARVYLSMRKYDLALNYAEEALNLYSSLMSFSTLNPTLNIPINFRNPETVFWGRPIESLSRLIAHVRRAPNTLVNPELYSLYSDDDLRKTIYFTNSTIHRKPGFKASYDGTLQLFTGIATDEIYLIKAECQVRLKEYQDGLNTLNSLLITRWKENTFVNFTATNKDEALKIVLLERRKELPFRGLRWQDLRRLNKEGANITLTRSFDGMTPYTLLPNSPLYVMPIPPEEMQYGLLEQNIR